MTNVSIFKNVTDVNGYSGGIELNEILGWIKSGDYGLKDKISSIRNCQYDFLTKELKKDLPLFTPNGLFSQRNSASLVQYSNAVVLDFDFDQADKIAAFKQKLIQYATQLHLRAVWLSPAHGVKALMIHDNTDPSMHYNMFKQIKKNLFPNTPEFDENCSDLCRGCFLSWDPDIFINQDPNLQPYHFLFDPSMSQPPTKTQSNSGNHVRGEFQHTQDEIDLNNSFQAVCTDKALMNSLVKSFNANNPDYYKDGNRHSEIKRRAVIYCKDGVLYDNAVWSLVGQFGKNSRAGMDDDDIRSMVSSCYHNARNEFGNERVKYLNYSRNHQE